MKRITLLSLSLLLILFFSCHKKEFLQDVSQTKPKQAFVDVSAIKNELLKGVASELNRQDSLAGIQDFFYKKYGDLLWEHAITQQQNRKTLAIIPFTKSHKNTEGYLVATYSNDKYSFELFNKASAFSNGWKARTDGKPDNYQIQAVLDYFNATIFNITTRKLVTILQVQDTVQRRKMVEKRGTWDAGGLFVKYSFPKSNATQTCVVITESTDIWYDPDGDLDPCDCSGNEVYDHTEYHSYLKCTDQVSGGGGGGSTDPGGGEGSGGNGGNTNPGGGGTPPTGSGGPGNTGDPSLDPNINWLYPPGKLINLGDDYGIFAADDDWISQLQDEFDTFDPSGSNSFNSSNLLNYGANKGWAAGITRNRKCGKFFEESALRFWGLTPNGLNYPSQRRDLLTAASVKPMNKFRPDGLSGTMYIYTDKANTQGQTIMQLSNYFMTEVKATSGTLKLNTSNYQMEAELDFLYHRRLEAESSSSVPIKVKPILFLITTADATIDPELKTWADNHDVWIWHSYSTYRITDPATGAFTIDYSYPTWVAAHSSPYAPGTKIPDDWASILPILGHGLFVNRHDNPDPGPNYDVDPEEVE